MNALKQYLVEKFGLSADADDAAVKAFAAEKVHAKELDLDTYMGLIAPKGASPVDEIVTKLSSVLAEQLKAAKPAPAPEKKETPAPAPRDFDAELKSMEDRLAEKFAAQLAEKDTANPGDTFVKMAQSDLAVDSPVSIRGKSAVEGYKDTKTALTYKQSHDKTLGRYEQPIVFDGKEVNAPTERTKYMSAVWAKFQIDPTNLNERDEAVVQHILHNEKFHVPSSNPLATEARKLTADERVSVYMGHKNFYSSGMYKADLLDGTTSGGSYSVPEFFDMDMIIAPTLASENLVSLCNTIPVPRGSSAQNFILGRPTVTSEPEGEAGAVFDATAFIANHDTPFFRAAGYVRVGLNYLQDAHPRIVQEIYNQYRASSALWMHEQIVNGDGTTEPKGILNTSSVLDIASVNGTGGAVSIVDVLNLLFGVSKAYRMNGAANRAVYIMTETTYKRIRSLATGVTGDTRLIFGMNPEEYSLFGHPVKIEEVGLANNQVIFCQMSGYRMYLRQGLRLIRETAGQTLTLANEVLLGVDFRVGGQLDLPGYAALIDDLAS